MPKQLPLIGLLCLAFLFAKAQIADEKDFVRYSIRDGLIDNYINCIQQDEWGYIWVGTDAGLDRFDGHSFAEPAPFPPDLSCKISRIKRLSPHRLAILSDAGCQVLNTQQGTTQDLLLPDTTAFATVLNSTWDAADLTRGGYALTTNAGFYAFDTTGKLIFRHDAYTPADIGNKRNRYGRDIFSLDDTAYLVYTEDHDITLYDPIRATFRPIDTSEKQWQVFYSCQAPGGELWRSKYQLNDHQFLFIDIQHDAIMFYDRRQNRIVTSPLPFHCLKELNWNSTITALDSGRFAVNCSNNGFYLLHLDGQTGAVSCEPDKLLPASEVNCLFFDRQRRLWAGTTRGLLRQRLHAPFFHAYALDPGYKKSAYTEGLTCAYRYKDKLYVGRYSRGIGLSILDTATMTDRQDLRFFGEDNMWNEVISIQLYHPDTLWLGTNGGIIWLDTKTNHYGDVLPTLKNIPSGILEQLRYHPKNALFITLQPTNADGNAWMAFGLRGIVGRYHPASGNMTFFTTETKPALPFKQVKQLVTDSYGDVWFSGHGLARWNSRKQSFDTLMTAYGGPRKFNTNILSITADDAGSLWLHNQQNGLLEYRIAEKHFNYYGPAAGLPSTVFQSISPVVDHMVWLATGANTTAFNTRNKTAIVYDYGDAGMDDKPTSGKI
jgi:ligand-binding sensor domain-containing protein